MTTNRLAVIPAGHAGKVTVESLHAYAERLNAEHWVQASGKPYFVNTRPGDGGVVHFLDRQGAA